MGTIIILSLLALCVSACSDDPILQGTADAGFRMMMAPGQPQQYPQQNPQQPLWPDEPSGGYGDSFDPDASIPVSQTRPTDPTRFDGGTMPDVHRIQMTQWMTPPMDSIDMGLDMADAMVDTTADAQPQDPEPMPQCIPDCQDKECDSDGCGGQCEPGCGAGLFVLTDRVRILPLGSIFRAPSAMAAMPVVVVVAFVGSLTSTFRRWFASRQAETTVQMDVFDVSAPFAFKHPFESLETKPSMGAISESL